MRNRFCFNGIYFCILLLSVFSSNNLPAQTTDEEKLKAEAEKIVQAFAGQLKPRLLQSLESNGPAGTIAVCAEQAPAIAKQLSEESGWNVKRVSLKTRNNKSAAPDDWERQVLRDFDSRKAQGESADTLVRAEVVKGAFRFMKAQPVEGLCLLCHGTNIGAEVSDALATHYPNDSATGYSLGEIRGAFSLTKPQ